MREQLLLLIELQKIDTAINRINHRKKELPDMISKLNDAFALLKTGAENDAKAVDDLQKSLKEKEEKLKRGAETLKKTKERLTEVKTNKEYQAVLKEIESIELKNGEYEDEIIVFFDEIDNAKASFKQKQQDFDAYRLQYEMEKAGLEQEFQRIDSDLADCQAKGMALRTKIDEDVLKRYEVIKNRNNGLAVVAVWKEVCHGCYMNIPPQLYNQLLSASSLLFCPNCNRIMYPKGPDENDQ
ncbi:MAG: hypothetical protein JXA41_10900 [Deltaproteobacteria bacterium]|nr:hypothetical protein [Deltaproteobacteria bacterium]